MPRKAPHFRREEHARPGERVEILPLLLALVKYQETKHKNLSVLFNLHYWDSSLVTAILTSYSLCRCCTPFTTPRIKL
jgi:hypothetical protein